MQFCPDRTKPIHIFGHFRRELGACRQVWTYRLHTLNKSDRLGQPSNVRRASKYTFQSQDSAVRIHQGRVRSDRATQRLVRHRHINNHHTVLRRRLPYANVFIRLHRHMCERNELLVNPKTRQLHCTTPLSQTISTSTTAIFPTLTFSLPPPPASRYTKPSLQQQSKTKTEKNNK